MMIKGWERKVIIRCIQKGEIIRILDLRQSKPGSTNQWEEDNHQEGQLAGMTIVRKDKCQGDFGLGGHISLIFLLCRMGYNWKCLDLYIVILTFILRFILMETKDKVNNLNSLICISTCYI